MNRMTVLVVAVASIVWGAACSRGITGRPGSGGSNEAGVGSGGGTGSDGAIVVWGTTGPDGEIVSGGTTDSDGAVDSGGATGSGGTVDGTDTDAGDAGVSDGGPVLDGPDTEGSAQPDVPTDTAVDGQSGGLEVGSPADCAVPSPIAFGVVAVSGPTYGATAKYTCSTGYSLAGSATRICQANGTWSGTPPICVSVDCGAPPAIANGSIVAVGTTYGGTAIYTCSAGYSLKGSATRTCQADGTWNGTPPACSVQTTPTLAINKVGAGTVASTPAGINCGTLCQAPFAAGTVVTLVAMPDANQTFMGWDSTACTGMGTCSFTLTSNTVVRASFSPPPNIMFTTSTTQTPALGGLSGGDAICAALAASAGLSGTYKAWLSTSTVNAISRLAGASGWVRTDGKPVVNSPADFAQGRLLYPPRLDERGNDLGADPIVMTGTSTDGTVSNVSNFTTCNDFTSAVATGDLLASGYASASSTMYTTDAPMDCSSSARLYCFGVDRKTQVAVTPAVGRYAFVTHSAWSPGGGIVAADALCQQEAGVAALPGTYKALLAPTGSSAASRFDTNGLPWIRSDGIQIAPTAAALFSATVFDVPPNLSADGSIYFGATGVWSGAATPTTAGKGATNCANWMSTSAAATAAVGAAGDTAASSFFNMWPADVACNGSNVHLACLQE